MIAQTALFALHPCPLAASRHRARDARWPALCAAVACAGALCAQGAHATRPKPPRAASTPSTAQILAPSQATVPDALPVDRTVYRCGNAYSSQPCGAAPPLDVADARSASQRRQSQDVAARDKRLAQWMEAGRKDREKVASAPDKRRGAYDGQCVSTASMVCKPRWPRPRHAVTSAASAASKP